MSTPFPLAAGPLQVTDVTLRDGHQSILATRMRTRDLVQVAALLDTIGYHSLEVWGGATFDVATRFLNEDPWERVRIMKVAAPRTPFMMLLRGQNLVGYRHYADDVVEAFVRYSAGVGIDIFRVFDALNDLRNLETAFRAIGDAGKHIQGTVVYTLTGHRMGGPIFNLAYYVEKARAIERMGAHSLCVKDMAGLLAPYDAYDLISALKDTVAIPVQLHSHYSSGMAQMTALKAIEAGVDILDTALAPLALRSSHPPIEPLVAALQGTPRALALDLDALTAAGRVLEKLLPAYRQHLEADQMSLIDTNVLTHQVPGGMISNLVTQLREAGALERLDEVLQELPRTRKELGYPPLVTPTSQIVGIQAVQNVLFGRYTMVSAQVKDYVYGLYGRSPAPMDPEVVRLALKGYERGDVPISVRPADILEPEMGKARRESDGLAKDEGDLLIYALYPVTGLRFLRWKQGLEAPPPEVQPPEARLAPAAPAASPEAVPPPSPRTRSYTVRVGGEQFQVTVDPVEGGSPTIVPDAAPPSPGPPRSPPRSRPPPLAPPPPRPAAGAPGSPTTAPAGGAIVTAPMPGLVIRYAVSVGQAVKAGDPIAIVEAMKMQNSLPSPVDGVILELPRQPGDRVARGDILAVIGPP